MSGPTCGPGRLIIFSAPSGSGKTTIIRQLMQRIPNLAFSVSATCRAPRGEECHGVDYYFLTYDEFQEAVARDEFVEWEEVYPGTCYGTLCREMERIWQNGCTILFDVDVKGGLRLKELFGERALSIFVMPPSVEELGRRLVGRGTDAPQVIARRIAKAETELSYAPRFDHTIVNDELDHAVSQAAVLVENFLSRPLCGK